MMRTIVNQLRSARPTRRQDRPVHQLADDFENLLGDLSAAFVQATPAAIDSEITRWLKRIVLTLDLDRASVLQIDPLTHRVYLSHQWARADVPKTPQRLDLRELIPSYTQKLLAGESIVYSDVDHLPQELAEDAVRARAFRPKSHVAIPVRIGDGVVGGVGFSTHRRIKIWDTRLLKRLHLIAEVFANALERKRTAMRDAKLREELFRSSQAAVVGELAASVAHELNQPIAAILSNAEAIQSLLEGEQPDMAEIRTAINEIIHDDNRAGETIRRLRALFQREQLEKEALDIGEVMREIGRLIQSLALAGNVSFVLDVARPLPRVWVDRVQVQQAVLNLVRNALDAVHESKQGFKKVVLKVRKKAGCVVIEVSDSGPGIDPSMAPRIFDPFFTTKQSGMGVGLAMSRSIVEAHGGRLSVADTATGATFVIELPARSRMKS